MSLLSEQSLAIAESWLEEMIDIYIQTGDSSGIKSYLESFPDLMKTEAIQKLLFSFMDGDITRPNHRPVSTETLRQQVVCNIFFLMFLGSNQTEAIALVAEKYHKHVDTIRKDYLKPYVDRKCEMLGLSKKEFMKAGVDHDFPVMLAIGDAREYLNPNTSEAVKSYIAEIWGISR